MEECEAIFDFKKQCQECSSVFYHQRQGRLVGSSLASFHSRPKAMMCLRCLPNFTIRFGFVRGNGLGGHLDVTQRALAGSLSDMATGATSQVPMVFQRMLRMVCPKYLPVAKVFQCLFLRLVPSDLRWRVQSGFGGFPRHTLALFNLLHAS